MARSSIVRSVVVVLLSTGALACAMGRERPVPLASEAELDMRRMRPDRFHSPVLADAEPACARAVAELDARIAEGELDRAEALLPAARTACGPGYGLEWRRGWIARERGQFDRAARAYLSELDEPTPADPTGAQLLDVLPHALPSTRRTAARMGSNSRSAYAGGFDGVDSDRFVTLRCGGKPAVLLRISCDRDPPQCTYRYRCRNGLIRDVVVGSRELWFLDDT